MIEARIWPQCGAIAETMWSSPADLDVADMYRRLFRLSVMLDREGVLNQKDFTLKVENLAGTMPEEPVRTLLTVLVPLKGLRRIMIRTLTPVPDRQPLDRVADLVLVDSEAKYEFRNAVAKYLTTHDPESEHIVRTWLSRWSRNDEVLQPYFAQSKKLQEVAGHSKRLAALANAGLTALDSLHSGKPLSKEQLEQDDALLKDAQSSDGETELAVLSELSALFHGKLLEEPRSYSLF